MVGSDLIDMFTKFKVTTYVGLEDFVDKLNFLFTCSFLMICCTVVTVKTYFMSPLSCYIATPVSGTGNMDYVNAWCWAEGTYAIDVRDMDRLNIQGLHKIADKKIHYYQWVPFVLGLQCVLFYMPRVIWQFFSHNCTGTDLEFIVSLANDAVHSEPEKRKKLVDNIVRSLVNVLYQHREYRTNGLTVLKRQLHRFCTFLMPSKRLGTKLVNFYIIIKLLYTVNSISQLYLMHTFLKMPGKHPFFGFDLLRNLTQGRDWQNTQIFPRIGGCGMLLKIAGATHWQIAQCALPVNMLNEKLYIFLWFWIFILSALNVFSIVRWIIRISLVSRQYKFIKKFLRLNGVYNRDSSDSRGLKKAIRQFCKAFLRQDGVFMLKMLSINTGDLICSEIVLKLWDTYKKKYIERDFRDDTEVPAAVKGAAAPGGGSVGIDLGTPDRVDSMKLPLHEIAPASISPVGFSGSDDGKRPLLRSPTPTGGGNGRHPPASQHHLPTSQKSTLKAVKAPAPPPPQPPQMANGIKPPSFDMANLYNEHC